MSIEQSAPSGAPPTFGRQIEHRETPPLVSVCIPTFNGADYLPYAIHSVLSQSLADLELVVMDNHSTDNTQKIVEGLQDPRVRYIRHGKTIPLEANWNACLEASKGKYFKLLPHDDLLEHHCLAQQVAPFECDNQGELALVFGARRIIDHSGRELMVRGKLASTETRIGSSRLVRRCIRAGANLIGEPGNGLVRRDLLARTGGFDTRHPYLTDLDFWFRALQQGDAYFTGTITSSFRVTLGSWSAAIGRAQYGDFANFLEESMRVPKFGITRTDRLVGLSMARANTLGRLLIYRALSWRNQYKRAKA